MSVFDIEGRVATLYSGDALAVIPTLSGMFGAVVTDPPYASGAGTAAGRQRSTAQKYTGTKSACPMPDFEGDATDQRSWAHLMSDVLRAARARCVDGAVLCAFTDWRQLPSLTDAIQWAGWAWRGVAVWDKVNSRPQRGRFRQQSEFIVWASNGAMPAERGVEILPGVFTYVQQPTTQRFHQTQKPLELMRQIVRLCAPGEAILDPFAGSGTTLIAAALEGHDSAGIEVSEKYFDIAQQRLLAVRQGGVT